MPLAPLLLSFSANTSTSCFSDKLISAYGFLAFELPVILLSGCFTYQLEDPAVYPDEY